MDPTREKGKRRCLKVWTYQGREVREAIPLLTRRLCCYLSIHPLGPGAAETETAVKAEGCGQGGTSAAVEPVMVSPWNSHRLVTLHRPLLRLTRGPACVLHARLKQLFVDHADRLANPRRPPPAKSDEAAGPLLRCLGDGACVSDFLQGAHGLFLPLSKTYSVEHTVQRLQGEGFTARGVGVAELKAALEVEERDVKGLRDYYDLTAPMLRYRRFHIQQTIDALSEWCEMGWQKVSVD